MGNERVKNALQLGWGKEKVKGLKWEMKGLKNLSTRLGKRKSKKVRD